MQFIKGKTDCALEDAGYDESRIETLHKHLERIIENGTIQCVAYCMSHHGKVFAHAAVGPKSYKKDDNTPLSPDCIQYIASITKTFTAVAIMKLVEDGFTRLDIPVGEILPQFAGRPFDKITLFHLLTHTSGLHPDPHCFPDKFKASYWRQIEKEYALHKSEDGEFDWIAAALGVAGSEFSIKPGREWAYCTFGFVILGAVIQKLTGIFAHKYIENNILKPLKMTDSRFDLTPDMARRCIIQNPEREEYVNSVINGSFKKNAPWDKIPQTGGGLESTVYDLNRFGNMILFNGTFDGARILGRKAVEKMTALALHNTPDHCWGAEEPNRRYSIGFDMRCGLPFTLSRDSVSHEGSGYSGFYIDLYEEFVASWFVPYVNEDEWHPEALWNVQNIMWSGII